MVVSQFFRGFKAYTLNNLTFKSHLWFRLCVFFYMFLAQDTSKPLTGIYLVKPSM